MPSLRPTQSLEEPKQAIFSTQRIPSFDKPLPTLPPNPVQGGPPIDTSPTTWFDARSTPPSLSGHCPSRETIEDYPVVNDCDPDDLLMRVNHPPAHTLFEKLKSTSRPRIITTSFLHDNRNEYPLTRTAPPTRPNHYFREKKWDYFPELAPISALPANLNQSFNARKKKNGRPAPTLHKSYRHINSDYPFLSHSRNAITSGVHRLFSKNFNGNGLTR
ncbi:hypothetical protein BDV30DRAFT_233734 [Aspergillus minisclerotigenes]|uniref:Uncharacterized protein n=1 Tax=Aspergillus minisclerotigenes TaxID=656917 RepID=A0A5N6JKF8_9EURO|nr:hypothetical protein BDV30DRAFT_233734 [Aspergillus minisclerotigenes]